MTLSRTNPRAKQRWTLLGAVVLALTLIGAFVAQGAPLDKTLFELDGDATNDTRYVKVGVLNAAVASSSSPTTITICQALANFANGTKILVNAERMTLSNPSTPPGGGCPSEFPNKRNYTAARGVDGTNPGAHAKAEDVSRIDTGAFDGADWNQVYANIDADPDSKCDSAALIDLGAVECFYMSDGRAKSVFTQAKDYDEISDTSGIWQWRDQSVPDANELDDAFAIKYVDGSGDQHLYFGADRFAVNGTKDAGFWFFHDDVAKLDPVGSADGLFSGVHTPPDDGGDGFCNPGAGGVPTPPNTGAQTNPRNCTTYDSNDSAGDVLVLTTFTGGGAVTSIRVFEWIGPSGSVAALHERGVQGDCVPGAASQELCATVNKTTVESAWPYSGKGEPANNQIPSGGLLEGGINLTARGLEGCFSSFMATTRSSAELTADLKDFILGSFEACDSSLTTTPKDGEGNGLTADTNENNLDEITIGTDGRVEVTDSAVLDVQGTTTFSGELNFYLCGPFANPNACDDTGVEIGAADLVNPVTANGTYASAVATLTEVGRYCWYATFESATPGLEAGASDGTIESPGSTGPPEVPYSTGECFEVLPVAPTLSTQASNPTLSTAALFGTAIDDTAFLDGTARQPQDGGPNSTYPTIHTADSLPAELGDPAGGTITFKLYGPSDTASCVDPATGVTGNLIGTSVVDVSGDSPPATYEASAGTITGTLVPPSPGRYWWTASYSGDPPNTLPAPKDADDEATFTPCGDTNESSFVAQIPPSIQTAQWIYPNDDATVAVIAGGDITGTLQFRLFDSLANCTANTTDGTIGDDGLLYEETITITDDDDSVAGADSETRSTSNITEKVSASTIVYWRVLFTSTNSAHEHRLSDCTENTDVTFTGNNTGSGVKP